MKRLSVSSREYKVMLRRKRFRGDDRALLKAAEAFWDDFSHRVRGVALGVGGRFATTKPPRLITFHDTSKEHLNARQYIFRDRRELRSGRREVTLKFRHPDRHVAQGRSMKARGDGGDTKTKFEEDIKAPFVSLYSFSTTVEVGRDRAFGTLADVARLFPDLVKRIEPFDASRPLRAVNDFTAREVVLSGGTLQVGKHPNVEAEAALIVWYDHADRNRAERPVAVEFSFRYGNDEERYEAATARRAFDVFDILQRKLGRWVDPDSETKTGFVYG